MGRKRNKKNQRFNMSYNNLKLRYQSQENEADQDPVSVELETHEGIYQAKFDIDVKYPPKLFELDYFSRHLKTPILQCDENNNIIFHRKCKKDQPCWCELLDSLIWQGEGNMTIPFENENNYVIKLSAKVNKDTKVIHMELKFEWEYPKPKTHVNNNQAVTVWKGGQSHNIPSYIC